MKQIRIIISEEQIPEEKPTKGFFRRRRESKERDIFRILTVDSEINLKKVLQTIVEGPGGGKP